MPKPQTEARLPGSEGLDAREDTGILAALLEGQRCALGALDGVFREISQAADRMAETIRGGGRIWYVASGSSGLMALADACELGGTFGLPAAQIGILMSGGLPVDARMPGDSEDGVAAARKAATALEQNDVIIAISASGSTPWPLEIAAAAHACGAGVIAVSNNRGAPLSALADVAIELETPPEVLAGSTRLGAGTAQKAALNMMSTLMGVRLGHVHDGLMVNLVADNAKLRARAVAIVAGIAGVDADFAHAALEATAGAVKPAVLVARGQTPDAAARLLETTRGNLRAALARL